MLTACVGQCSEQAPQLVPSVCTMQNRFKKTTFPICVRCFSSWVKGRIAPLGHTSEQTVQSKLQKPFSKSIIGCIIPARPYCVKAGFNTFEGHLLMHK